MADDQQKRKRHAGVPEAEIRAAMTSITQVAIKVSRQNMQGKIATVISYMIVSLEELLNIEAMMHSTAGGGNYLVDVRNIDSTELEAIPPFSFAIEGNPKPSTIASPTAPMPMPPHMQAGTPSPVSAAIGGGGGFVAPAPVTHAGFISHQAHGGAQMPMFLEGPPWPPGWDFYKGYPPAQQWEMFRQYLPQHPANQLASQVHHAMGPSGGGAPQLPPGASMPSDAMAMYYSRQTQQEAMQARSEVARLMERNERLMAEINSANKAAEEARRQGELQAAEARHQAELGKLTAMVESLKNAQPATPQLMQIATAIAPFVPVLTAMVSKDDGHGKMMELMLAAQQKPKGPSETSEILKVALPAIAPIILGLIQSRSPEAQMEVLQQATQGQMAMIKMMADFVASQNQGEDTPWWHPLLATALEAVKGVGAGMAMQQSQQQAPRQLPPPSQARPSPSPRKHEPFMGADDALFQYDAEAAKYVKMIYDVAAPEIRDFETAEWKTLLFNMHMKLDPEELVPVLADHLEHLRVFNIMPRVLAGVFEDPEKVLGELLGRLPIGQLDKDYTSRLLVATVNEVLNRERERVKVEQESAAEAGEDASNGGTSAEEESDDEGEDDESDDEDAPAEPEPTVGHA